MNKTISVLIACTLFCSQLGLGQTTVRSHLLTDPVGALELEAPALQMETRFERKSVTLAVLYSLILPGMGELYAGNFDTGKYSLMAEVGLWVTYAGFRSHGDWLRQDARSFARQHSNVSFDSKDEQFEVNLGNFNTTLEYNEAKLRNREYDLLYSGSDFAWQWDSDADRLAFKDLRIRSDQVYQNSKFVLAAVVINRILSAFSAGKAAATYNRIPRSLGEWRLQASPSGGLLNAHGVELQFSTEF